MKKVVVIVLTILLCFPFSYQSYASSTSLVFVVDASGSMRGEKILGAKEALRNITSRIETRLPISIYSFNTSTNLQVFLSSDTQLISEGITKIEAKGKTSLYDSIVDIINTSKIINARILFLTDGSDSSSVTKLEELLKILESNKFNRNIIDFIGLNVEEADAETLAKIARVTGGSYYPITAIDELFEVYTSILTTIPANIVNVENNDFNSFRNLEAEITLAIVSALMIIWLLRIFSLNLARRKNQIQRFNKLQIYANRRSRKRVARLQAIVRNFLFIPGPIQKILRRKLNLIHREQSYINIMKLLLIAWIVSVFVLNVFFQNLLLSLILSVVFPPMIFLFGTNALLRKQRQQFEDELPEMLNVVSSGLNAGLGLQQSLEAFSTDTNGEAARQIRRALGEVHVGAPIDEALMAISERMENEDLKWAITALSIQRIVGGSLATILQTAYETVKSRSEIRREVRTLAAEGKLSGKVLMALPVVIFFFLLLTRREYVQVFWTEPLGIIMLIAMISNMLIGSFWMNRIVDIKL